MRAVAVGANDLAGVFFAGTTLLPTGDDLGRGHVVLLVALFAGRVDHVLRVHDVGRGDVVFIVAVGVGLAVTLHAADVLPSVHDDHVLLLVVRVADVARAVVGHRPVGRFRGGFVRHRVQQERGAAIDD